MRILGYHRCNEDKLTILRKFMKGAKECGCTGKIYRYSDNPVRFAECYIFFGYGIVVNNIQKINKQDPNPRIILFDPHVRGTRFKRRCKDFSEYYSVSMTSPYDNFTFYDDAPNDRWNQLKDVYNVQVKPWRENGEYIAIAHTPHTTFSKKDREPMLRSVIKKCVKTGREVVICARPHDCHKKGHLDNLRSDYSEFGCRVVSGVRSALNGAHCLISYGGPSAVDGILSGIPSLSLEKNTSDMLFPNKKIDKFLKDPPTPNREHWFNWLGYQQWTIEEMSQGIPWKYLYDRFLKKIRGH